jgi:hypothetical protein
MYITSSEYAFLTGRDSNEATNIRIKLACKLLDSRIGNHYVYTDGYKIDTSSSIWQIDENDMTQEQKDSVQMWVAKAVEFLYQNGDSPQENKNVKLGRFSVGNSSTSTGSNLPDVLKLYDSILVSSGIINRNISLKERIYDGRYYV